jgi:hypothetical protein
MKQDQRPNFDWDTLAKSAQRAPRPDAPPAPQALATRVLALAREARSTESLWLSWCLRAAFASITVALILPFLLHVNSDSALATNAGIESQIAELVFAP